MLFGLSVVGLGSYADVCSCCNSSFSSSGQGQINSVSGKRSACFVRDVLVYGARKKKWIGLEFEGEEKKN